jgi:hypothetical protein
MKKFTSIVFTLAVLSLFDATTSYGQWSSLTMQSSRYRLAAAANNDIAVFYGGIGLISIPPPAADIYDASTGAVSPKTTNRGRTDLAGTSCGSKLLFGGGADEWILSVFTDVEMYDGVTGGWSTMDLSVARSKLAATSSGNLVFFGGGIDRDGQQKVYKVVDVYDTTTALWSAGTFSLARHSLAAASAGGKVLFAGGANFTDVAFNRVDIYDVATSTWSIDSLSQARYGCTATAVGNKIFIAGGIDSLHNPSNIVDIYDVVTGTWTHDVLSVARGYLSSATVGDMVFFAGGSNADFSAIYSEVDIFNTTTQTWSTSQLNTGRTLAAATSIAGLFMIGGGIRDGGLPLNSIEVYSLIDGINNPLFSDAQVSVFPNPVTDNVNLKLINTISAGNLEIVNDIGQVIYYTSLNNNISELNINFSSFTQGVYTIKINDGKKSLVKKFIKI